MDSLNNNQTGLTSQAVGNKGKFTPDEIIETDILELMGAKDMTDEKKREIYDQMVKTIEMRVLIRIDDQLSDQDVEKVKTAIASNNKEQFLQVLKDKNINVVDIYSEEALIYKFEMVELMNKKTEE